MNTKFKSSPKIFPLQSLRNLKNDYQQQGVVNNNGYIKNCFPDYYNLRLFKRYLPYISQFRLTSSLSPYNKPPTCVAIWPLLDGHLVTTDLAFSSIINHKSITISMADVQIYSTLSFHQYRPLRHAPSKESGHLHSPRVLMRKFRPDRFFQRNTNLQNNCIMYAFRELYNFDAFRSTINRYLILFMLPICTSFYLLLRSYHTTRSVSLYHQWLLGLYRVKRNNLKQSGYRMGDKYLPIRYGKRL